MYIYSGLHEVKPITHHFTIHAHTYVHVHASLHTISYRVMYMLQHNEQHVSVHIHTHTHIYTVLHSHNYETLCCARHAGIYITGDSLPVRSTCMAPIFCIYISQSLQTQQLASVQKECSAYISALCSSVHAIHVMI